MTLSLIVANVLTFFALPIDAIEVWSFDPRRTHLVPSVTWITSAFLHGNWLHMLGNMWFLFVFGRALEAHWGQRQFLVVYLWSAVVALLSYAALTPAAGPVIGASGAVSGILGAFTVMDCRRQVLSLLFLGVFSQLLTVPSVVYLGIWLALHIDAVQSVYSSSGSVQHVAWFAHLGGCSAGMLFAYSHRLAVAHFRPYSSGDLN